MKHFTITTDEQAKALRPYATEPVKLGHIVHPDAGSIVHTAWQEYRESDRITFEQCMSIVRDEVTEEVLRELGEVEVQKNCKLSTVIGEKMAVAMYNDGDVVLLLRDEVLGAGSISVPKPTATKLRILAAILKGEKL
jgi:hypothetical protein